MRRTSLDYQICSKSQEKNIESLNILTWQRVSTSQLNLDTFIHLSIKLALTTHRPLYTCLNHLKRYSISTISIMEATKFFSVTIVFIILSLIKHSISQAMFRPSLTLLLDEFHLDLQLTLFVWDPCKIQPNSRWCYGKSVLVASTRLNA